MSRFYVTEAATLEYLGEGSNQIPTLYAYFSENGQFYLVQEWIQGETLRKIVEDKGSISETVVREILLSLLSVLDYVHSKNIIHRDIKPDNIILRASDSKPVLIDFGAVKETIVSVVKSPGIYTQSMVIGTPGFMPSEQATGRPVYATDIYSLGLTAIYLLTGKQPQELETNLQTGEIIWQPHVPSVSPTLAMVLNQAIKPHAGDRYTTASKMLYALQSSSGSIHTTQEAKSQDTVALPAAVPTQQTQPLYSRQKTPVIPTSSPSDNWQKPAWIIGSLLAGGLIGAIAISGITRQQQPETPIATSPTPTESPITIPTPASEPTDTPVASPPLPTPTASAPPPPQVTPKPSPPAVTFTPPSPTQPQPLTSKTPAPAVTPTPPPQINPVELPNLVVSITPSQEQKQPVGNIPGFPTGTSESAVRAALGNPSKVSKGLWNTRAFLYKLQPNRVDLGYLFDRKTGMLRQTEVSFAQSVEPEVMQTTLQGMLGGNASGDIKQGLQRVYQRQTKRYSFEAGGLEGEIVRNEEDQIYIGVWDADLH